ncbi:MAG: OmpA family protein [Bacilli bacterium]|jgi:hypothetical protein
MSRAFLPLLFCVLVSVLFSGCGYAIKPDNLQNASLHFAVGEKLPDANSAFFLLGQAATILKLDKDLRLLIVGHTDATGTPEANQTLAFDRANSVKGFMVQLVPEVERQVRIAFYGADRPIYDNNTPEGRAGNRRVEFRFYRAGSDQKVEAELQGLYGGKLVFGTQTTASVQVQVKAP